MRAMGKPEHKRAHDLQYCTQKTVAHGARRGRPGNRSLTGTARCVSEGDRARQKLTLTHQTTFRVGDGHRSKVLSSRRAGDG